MDDAFGVADPISKEILQMGIIKEEEVKDFLRENYGIDKIISIDFLEKSMMNQNYLILDEEGKKFVFRIVRNKSRIKDLEFEFEFLTYLKNKSFPYEIPCPIAGINNKYYYKFKNFYCWIYNYIEGNQKEDLKKEFKEMAVLMATLHKLTKSLKLKSNRDIANGYLVGLIKDRIRKNKEISSKDTKIDKKYFNEILPFIEKIIFQLGEDRELLESYDKLDEYLIHSDIRANNTILQNGEIALIDFENIRYDSRIRDFTMFIINECREKEEINIKEVRRFLELYNSYSPLKKEELKHLKTIMITEILKGIPLFFKLFVEGKDLKYWNRVLENYNLLKNILNKQRELEELENIL